MAGLYGLTPSDNVFNSVLGTASQRTNSNNSALSSMLMTSGNALSDLAMIGNGSFKKLLDSYYKSQENKGVDSPSAKAEKLNLSKASSDAAELADAVSKLRNSDYSVDDKSELKENIKSFVKAYNSVIDSGSEVNDTSVLRNVLWMTQNTSKNAGVLSDLGISVDSKNKLQFDELKLDKADPARIGSVLKGYDSVMGRLEQRSNTINSLAVAAFSGEAASAYSSKGASYKSALNKDSIVDSLI